MIFINVGIMLSFLLGTYMAYDKAPFIMMLFPVFVFLSFLFIPDTPMSLLYRKKSDDSIEKSLKFYLNIKDTEDEHNQTRLNQALESVHAWSESKKNKPKFSWQELSNLLIYFGGSNEKAIQNVVVLFSS